ncbi:hypothetical protein BKA82DRAFT_26831 [Pisolithus tinctorius]|uniref:Uncharacterized protein n=1 Tax=Pisolithus tinctorius Marx 270 TaxID=870435 RepID=A0A0C3NSN7_PISTI|nr:hypothetical protein BKA82DRAFT_26831 [Pisolithus tinctorius]KIO03855.1 hypothetical protein M404DRAFT_26831 [Pisolithus tinctorius Marx 270]
MPVEAIAKTFPYFDDLDLIWRGNPSFDARPFTSNQTKDCAEEMLALVQGGGSCPGDNPEIEAVPDMDVDNNVAKDTGDFMAPDGYWRVDGVDGDDEFAYHGLEDENDGGDQGRLGTWDEDHNMLREHFEDVNAPELDLPFSTI